MTTRLGADDLGIESHWRRDIRHPSRTALGSTRLLRVVMQPGRVLEPTLTKSAEVKEGVELYAVLNSVD